MRQRMANAKQTRIVKVAMSWKIESYENVDVRKFMIQNGVNVVNFVILSQAGK